jgi:hypothetical protein
MSPPKSINHYGWPIKNNKHQLFLIYLFIYFFIVLFVPRLFQGFEICTFKKKKKKIVMANQ